MTHSVKTGWTAALLLALGLAACGGDETTITERKRQEADPRVGAFLIEGQRAFEEGAYAAALAFSDSAEALAPDLADVHFLRGIVYTQLNRLDVAQAAYETVLELDPDYRGARYNMALNAFRRGKLRDAIDLYQAERAHGESSDLMLELGRVYARLGEPDSAVWAYERAVALDSTNATAHMWLGQLYEELGEFDRALAASRTGLRLKPDDLDYRYIIGSQLFRTGAVEEARPYLAAVADAQPWHHGAQFNLGQVLMRLGEEDRAQTYFARADSAQQLQQKINEAQNAINRDPENLGHWVELAGLLRRAGQQDRAIEALEVAVSIDPFNLHLQNNLALMLAEDGRAARAIRRYHAILSLDSTMADVWFNLGVVYANDGQRGRARTAWRTTLRHAPNHPAAADYLRQLDAME